MRPLRGATRISWTKWITYRFSNFENAYGYSVDDILGEFLLKMESGGWDAVRRGYGKGDKGLYVDEVRALANNDEEFLSQVPEERLENIKHNFERLKKEPKYDPVMGYVKRVMTNQAIDLFRKLKSEAERTTPLDQDSPSQETPSTRSEPAAPRGQEISEHRVEFDFKAMLDYVRKHDPTRERNLADIFEDMWTNRTSEFAEFQDRYINPRTGEPYGKSWWSKKIDKIKVLLNQGFGMQWGM